MVTTAEAIALEIRALRKGRGMRAVSIVAKVGPHLRRLAIGDGDEPATLHHRLSQQLVIHAASLPDDLRLAATTSLSLSTDTRQHITFRDRVIWLSSRLGFQYRTALRRIDAAEKLLAEEIARELHRRDGMTGEASKGWYVEEFRTVLRLDTPTVEANEHRRIVAVRDSLAEVTISHDIPRNPGQIKTGMVAEIMYGGRMVRREQPTRSRIQFVVELPRRLRCGETHEFGMLLRAPAGESLRSHYIFTPENRCDTFILRVRFDQRRLPAWVRLVERETVRTFDDGHIVRQPVPVDPVGEVEVRFDNPTLYLGYGLQWQPTGA